MLAPVAEVTEVIKGMCVCRPVGLRALLLVCVCLCAAGWGSEPMKGQTAAISMNILIF